jgi:outer membrane protein OmpA-like peptidoglycan-associated protein
LGIYSFDSVPEGHYFFDDNFSKNAKGGWIMKARCGMALAVTATALTLLIGCAAPQTKTGKGAAYGTAGGAAVGAILGQAIGGDTEGTLAGAAIGAAVGAGAGAGIGRMMDKQEEEYRQALAATEAAAVRREGNLLAITLQGDVTFDTNSATVKPGLQDEISRIAQIMQQYPQTRVLVEGHTDSTGAPRYNQQLSEQRAESVAALLRQNGVAGSRVRTVGYGPDQPVATNNTAVGRQQNRRVEIKIDPMTQQGQG